MVSRRLLAYDTTNFYTYIASNHTRNELAQRGHNQQGRHNLRQVGLSYVLDGENGLSLCHHVYRGNVADAEEFSTSLARMLSMLDRCQVARDTVTLVIDKAPQLWPTRWNGRRREWAGFLPCRGIQLRWLFGNVRWNSCRSAVVRSPACVRPPKNCWCTAKNISVC